MILDGIKCVKITLRFETTLVYKFLSFRLIFVVHLHKLSIVGAACFVAPFILIQSI